MLVRAAALAAALTLLVPAVRGQAVEDEPRWSSPLEWWLDDVAQAARVRQLVAQGRLQELSDGTLAAVGARPSGRSVAGAVHHTVWPPLTQALAEARVDDEPWHALLLEHELDLRQAGSDRRLDRYQLGDWFFLVELLGAWERLAPPLLQARAQGATLDLVGHREALLLHARPEQAGALVTRFTSVVYAVLHDTERGPPQSFDSWASAGQQRFVVMDRYLDVVAAAYHAALVSGQRDQAGWVLRDARAAVRAREAARLPHLERRLADVDRALRAAGIEPLPPPAQPTDDQPTDDQPTDVPPTDVPPTDVPPTDDQPTDDQPTDDQPTDDQPTDDQPTDNQPTDDQPTDDQRSGDGR